MRNKNMFILYCVVRKVSSKEDILGGDPEVSFSCMWLRDARGGRGLNMLL